MRRIRLLVALAGGLILSAVLAVPAVFAQEPEPTETGGVRIQEVDTSTFPTVTISAVLEGASGDQALDEDDVTVTEDGKEVSRITVQNLTEQGDPVDVVLVIDTSGSMEGEPMAAAIAAALQFVTNMPDEGMRVGIVSFSDTPKIVQPITEDKAAALAALGGLVADGETALYDAVVEASTMFDGQGQRNMIVLSDGGDTVSEAKLKGAIAASKAADAVVYTVGLQTGEFDVNALRSIAEETDGRYAPAGAADLSSLYEGLAIELSNQYVIIYASTLKSGGEVTVSVTGPAGADSAFVLFPKVAPPPTAPTGPTQAPQAEPFLSGSVGLAIVVTLCFVAAFVLLVMMLGARDRSRRDRDLVRRVAAQAEDPEAAAAAEQGKERPGIAGWIPEGVVLGMEQLAKVGGFGSRIAMKLEQGGVPLRTGEFVGGIFIAAVFGALVGITVFGSPLFAVVFAGVAIMIPLFLLARAVKKRNKKLHGQLADVLMILASSLRAGHSFFQALDMVAKEIGEPASIEFGRVVAEIRLGRQVDEAMNAMAERIGSDDFKWAVLGVNIQREVGGNLAEVLDTVADTVRERDQIRRQIDVLSAEGRLSIGILTALPFLVALYIAKVNPGYLNLLFTTRMGLVMIATAGALMAIGIAWMRKIVKIDV